MILWVSSGASPRSRRRAACENIAVSFEPIASNQLKDAPDNQPPALRRSLADHRRELAVVLERGRRA
jgi:hypothetical protein